MPSIRSQIFKLYFRARNSRLPLDRPIPDQRETMDRRGRDLLPMAEEMLASPVDAFGVPSEWIDLQNTRSDRAFLYLHGGGYFIGSCQSHRGFVSHIAKACRCRTLLPEYRLAPEDPFPAGLLDARAAYRFLLAQGYTPSRIIVGGESSGGGLALALLQTLRDEGLPMPAGAVLLSPWTDLLGTGHSVHSLAARDPWLRPAGIPILANRYRGGAPTDHPLVSPLYGDLKGLPPLLIHAGNDEILRDDSTRLEARARSAGLEVTAKIWNGMWHAFHAFYPWVPEAKRAHKEIGEWVATRVETAKESETELETGHDSISRRPYRLRSTQLGSASQSRAAAAQTSGGLDLQPDQRRLSQLPAGR
ncbi:MAG: alpha/beta hydrolase [Caldilineaceae bacterium]|uniref:Alpha/beta hydrolase n=1 Tax=Caldilineaceae bacterium SB0675_bin_29 TaxID=2605266 RepID=A0A6B1G2Q5_9CHLR|nr:alpha/beta hydrolase [Caldilineaceae bacterium]MYH61696.1 alpha/beta hydrolase [Caldilineaceae bacterium SB0675_bin_29]